MLTADHGCDPSDVSTDHTREHVPLLVAGPARAGRARTWACGRRFADLGATLAENFGAGPARRRAARSWASSSQHLGQVLDNAGERR